MRYQCVHRRRTRYPIRMMCRALKVSASGYYAWRIRPESQRGRYDRELMRVIRRLHAQSDGTYGSPRLHEELLAGGYACGRPKVARLMREAGLKGCPKRRFRVTSRRGNTTATNLLDQNFSADPGRSHGGGVNRSVNPPAMATRGRPQSARVHSTTQIVANS